MITDENIYFYYTTCRFLTTACIYLSIKYFWHITKIRWEWWARRMILKFTYTLAFLEFKPEMKRDSMFVWFLIILNARVYTHNETLQLKLNRYSMPHLHTLKCLIWKSIWRYWHYMYFNYITGWCCVWVVAGYINYLIDIAYLFWYINVNNNWTCLSQICFYYHYDAIFAL